jgi:hypothetical protein
MTFNSRNAINVQLEIKVFVDQFDAIQTCQLDQIVQQKEADPPVMTSAVTCSKALNGVQLCGFGAWLVMLFTSTCFNGLPSAAITQ